MRDHRFSRGYHLHRIYVAVANRELPKHLASMRGGSHFIVCRSRLARGIGPRLYSIDNVVHGKTGRHGFTSHQRQAEPSRLSALPRKNGWPLPCPESAVAAGSLNMVAAALASRITPVVAQLVGHLHLQATLQDRLDHLVDQPVGAVDADTGRLSVGQQRVDPFRLKQLSQPLTGRILQRGRRDLLDNELGTIIDGGLDNLLFTYLRYNIELRREELTSTTSAVSLPNSPNSMPSSTSTGQTRKTKGPPSPPDPPAQIGNAQSLSGIARGADRSAEFGTKRGPATGNASAQTSKQVVRCGRALRGSQQWQRRLRGESMARKCSRRRCRR
jgi:hypothetical protein